MTASVPDYTEKEWAADGVSTAFSFQTKVLEAADIKVWLREGATLTLQTLGLHYSLSGLGDPSGVTINFVTAPASPKVVRARRQTVPKQTIDYGDLTKVPGDTTEAQLDRFAMALQDHQSVIDLELDLTGLVAAAAQSADEAAGSASQADDAAQRAEDAASSFTEIGTNFKTVPILLANDGTGARGLGYAGSGAAIIVAPGDIVTAQGFRYEVAAGGASDQHVVTAGGVKLYVLPNGDRMYAAAFGLIGDDSDETAQLLKLFSAGAGYEIRMGRAQTYRSTDTLLVAANTDFNLRGSTLNFAVVGAKRLLGVIGDNVTVRKGRVVNTLNQTGFEGTYQTPIVVARYTELVGYKDVVLKELVIEQATEGGNGIYVAGRSSNFIVENIHFPDSATLGIGVLSHWSFDEALRDEEDIRITSHQRNGVIRNISSGVLSYNPGASLTGQSLVFLSGTYNVKVQNVYAKEVRYGKAVTIYAGDWGFKFSEDPDEVIRATSGISVENVSGKALIAVEVYNQNVQFPPQEVQRSTIDISNVDMLGRGSASNGSDGIFLNAVDNITIRNCRLNGFYRGIRPAGKVTNLRIRDTVVENSVNQGFYGYPGTSSKGWEVTGCSFLNNNTGSAANIADIYLEAANDVLVKNNKFNSPLCAWNLRALNTVTQLRLIGNRSEAAPTSSCFSFGASTDYSIVSEYRNNVSAALPANGVRTGQRLVPHSTSAREGAVNELLRVFYFGGAPSAGPFVRGDIVWNDQPAASGAPGWVCTASGSPGTWKAMAALAA